MYINPFIAGVLTTLMIELAVIVGILFKISIKETEDKKGEDK